MAGEKDKQVKKAVARNRETPHRKSTKTRGGLFSATWAFFRRPLNEVDQKFLWLTLWNDDQVVLKIKFFPRSFRMCVHILKESSGREINRSMKQ